MCQSRAQPVRRLDHHDEPSGWTSSRDQLEQLESLRDGHVLEHRVEQQDVDLAGVVGDGLEGCWSRHCVQLDVGGPRALDVAAGELDRLRIDVVADVTLDVRRERTADRAGAAAVLEHGRVVERPQALHPGDHVVGGDGPAAAPLVVRVLGGPDPHPQPELPA